MFEWLCQEMERVLDTEVTEALRLAESWRWTSPRGFRSGKAAPAASRATPGHTSPRRAGAGDLPGAEEAITRARELWEACGPDDPDIGLADRFLGLVTG